MLQWLEWIGTGLLSRHTRVRILPGAPRSRSSEDERRGPNAEDAGSNPAGSTKMNVQIFAVDKKDGTRAEIDDLYWFEENHVHAFDEECGYMFELVVDGISLEDLLRRAILLHEISKDGKRRHRMVTQPSGDACF